MRALVTMNQPYKIEQETVSDPRSIEKSKDVDLLTAFISASCNTDAGKPKKTKKNKKKKKQKQKNVFLVTPGFPSFLFGYSVGVAA